jgi:hypothetical protein
MRTSCFTTRLPAATAALAALLALGAGCSADGGRDGDDGAGDDTETEYDGPAGSLGGTVLAPSGDFPIAGALVYLSLEDAPEIPDSIYCYECEDMTGKWWTLSNPDGTWFIDNVPAKEWKLVVRKGFFQRQRQVTVTADEHLDVPVSLTTLPADNSADGADQIPNYAVLLAHPDESYKLLGKFGMAQMSGSTIAWGTETFDAYNDDVSQAGYPPSTELFSDQATLDHYHMIFLPCYASAVGLSFADSRKDMVRAYLSGGGKIYNSCCVAYWTERALPAYIDFFGDDNANAWDVGRLFSSPHATAGKISDQGLRDWLQVVAPSSNPDAFPFQNGYTKIDALVPTDDGHGLEDDGFWVVPYSWVDGSGGDEYQGSPLMTTYTYDCGKVFYSVYETSPDSGTTITPQEFVLLYIILEVGVCEGEYIVE